ncbi:PA2169 family four-helix-bundle protein [Dyella sp. Tek66A03]|uniref:PA2169 family four-helix-bundle protein n=1 Tax=Dyella sp. Tek66A03 TaxID=3458298 RepID=UPI00403EDB52
MNERAYDIKVLNCLIESTLDSSEGYREAADQTKDVMIAELFKRWSVERRRVVAELRNAVRELGGEPEDDGTVLASAHRVFLDLRAHMDKTDKAVVDEVGRGEDHLKSKYEEALRDERLGPHALSVARKAFVSVTTGQDEIRELQKAYE